jgi:hypothetical protein
MPSRISRAEWSPVLAGRYLLGHHYVLIRRRLVGCHGAGILPAHPTMNGGLRGSPWRLRTCFPSSRKYRRACEDWVRMFFAACEIQALIALIEKNRGNLISASRGGQKSRALWAEPHSSQWAASSFIGALKWSVLTNPSQLSPTALPRQKTSTLGARHGHHAIRRIQWLFVGRATRAKCVPPVGSRTSAKPMAP